MKLAALSVDLDEIGCYQSIHGLTDALDGETARAVYRRAIPRYRALLAELGAPCTFFAVGADLDDDPASAEQARALVAEGHELGNHTFGHRYDLVRCDRDVQLAEVRLGIDAIERATGRAPTGFRAPGYTITDALFDVLDTCGVAYDSSVFPCPAYWGAKAAAIAWIGLRGRTSHSIVDTPSVLTAPANPYRPGRPYRRRGGRAIVELPIGVTVGARLPYIGTSLMLAGPERARWLTAMMLGRPLVNLELHGIDVLGAHEDGLGALAPHQPDLNVSVDRKLETLRRTVAQLRNEGYAFVTLADAASRVPKR